MNIKQPMRDMLVVERFTPEKVTASGIILPGETLDTNTVRGRVVSVGPGTVNEKTGEIVEIDVKVGDVVLFRSGSGMKVSEPKSEKEQYLLREEDILAILI